MPSHLVTIQHSRGSETIGKTVTYTADQEKGGDYTLAGGLTNQEITLSFDVSQLKVFLMYATVAMTIKTNSSGTPQETITLAADNPVLFRYDDGRGALFAGDVTKLYATVPGGVEGTLTIRALEDGTP